MVKAAADIDFQALIYELCGDNDNVYERSDLRQYLNIVVKGVADQSFINEVEDILHDLGYSDIFWKMMDMNMKMTIGPPGPGPTHFYVNKVRKG